MVRDRDDDEWTDLGLSPPLDDQAPTRRRAGRWPHRSAVPPEPTGTLGPVTPDAQPSTRHREHMAALREQMGWTDRPGWEERMDRARARRARALR